MIKAVFWKDLFCTGKEKDQRKITTFQDRGDEGLGK